MKNIIKIVTLTFFAATVFISCSKDSEGVSKVVTYPVFNLEGGNFITDTVRPTGSFVDPGVQAFSGDIEVPVISSGSVDITTPGLYILTYTAFDESGLFSVSAERKVLITNEKLTEDYFGTYVLKTNSSRIRTVSKPAGAMGWYRFSDSWWQAAAIPVEFVDFGSSLKVIPGNSNYGPFDGTVTYDTNEKELTFNLVFTSGTNAGVSWSSVWVKQ
ncbi:MAG: DUF5011 domain-containing protein [Prevotellaceae bacterium]|jgi:hypothetical protein|nr:DUF5011 domain-containing protein [Prevotellaceae bacterium]